MNYIERQKAIDLLKRVSKGGITIDEIKADYVISTFLDLMKVASEPLEKLEGKIIFLKDPMRSFFDELGHVGDGQTGQINPT